MPVLPRPPSAPRRRRLAGVLAVAVGAALLPLAATGSVAGAQDAGPSFEGDMAPPVLLPAPPG
ncbi:MAG: hypothetical protein WKF93_02120, partial [Acidimicrobiales bacterium]